MSSAGMQRVVIVGAGLAGLRTAERLRRAGFDGGLTLLGAESHHPYDRPPLSKTLLTQPDSPAEPVLLRRPDRFSALELDFVTGVEVTRLDVPARSVVTADGRSWSWDRLVLATGVRPRSVPGWAAAGVHLLRTFEDCLQLRASLVGASHLAVIGAGVLGCEVAAAGRKLGLEVDLIEPLETPLHRAVGPTIGSFVSALHLRHGVRLHMGVGVSAVDGDADGNAVTLTDGSRLLPDVVFAAVGSVPNTEWLADSGVALGDGVICDATGTTSHPDVLAVGDVANMPHGAEPPSRLEHWTSAADTAALVAGNVLLPHEHRRELTEVPYFWTDQYDVKLQTLGAPALQDDVTVVEGAVDQDQFLALHSRTDRITAISGAGHPAMVNKCRSLVASGASCEEALRTRAWSQAASPR